MYLHTAGMLSITCFIRVIINTYVYYFFGCLLHFACVNVCLLVCKNQKKQTQNKNRVPFGDIGCFILRNSNLNINYINSTLAKCNLPFSIRQIWMPHGLSEDWVIKQLPNLKNLEYVEWLVVFHN